MAPQFKPCSIADCNGNSHRDGYGCRDMCSTHYQRLRAHGDPLIRTMRPDNSSLPCTVSGCGSPTRSLGFCDAHYKRFWRYGDPLEGGTSKRAIPKWLAEHVNYQGDDCLIWPFYRNENGYACCDAKLGSGFAPRVLCAMAHGEPPSPDHEASHSCGNGNLGCMNQKHLRWLTHAENMEETLIHGTHNRGERNGQSTLTEEQVRRIRYLSGILTQQEIADRFEVSVNHVSMIVSRDRWGWLD